MALFSICVVDSHTDAKNHTELGSAMHDNTKSAHKLEYYFHFIIYIYDMIEQEATAFYKQVANLFIVC